MKFLVANDKGGVGKSLIAQFLVIAARGAGLDPRIVEYDRQPKQRRWFPGETETFALTPEMAAILATPERLAGFWDPLLDWLRDDRPLVVDFGAQAWSFFGQWASLSGLSGFCRGRGVWVVVPVTADIEAVESALGILESLPALLPEARVLLLTLDKDGPVDSLSGVPEYDRLMALARDRGAVVRPLAVLRAEVWPALAARGLRLDRIVAPGMVEDVSGLSPTAVARAVAATRAWLRDAYGVFLPLILSGEAGKAASKAEPSSAPPPSRPPHSPRARPDSVGGGMAALRRRAFKTGL